MRISRNTYIINVETIEVTRRLTFCRLGKSGVTTNGVHCVPYQLLLRRHDLYVVLLLTPSTSRLFVNLLPVVLFPGSSNLDTLVVSGES